MPLKQSYLTEAEVPTELKSFYSPKDGKYVLQVEGIESIAGIASKNTELLSKHSEDKTEITRLTGEVSRLQTDLNGKQILPTGHVAVPKADATLLQTLKPLGNADEIKTKLDEHATLKEKVESREREDLYAQAAEITGYNPAAFKSAARALGLAVELKEVEVDGKKVKKPFVGDKSLAEHVEATPELKALEPAFLVRESGTKFVKQPSGTGKAPTGNTYDKIRQEEKEKQEKRKPSSTLDDRFPRAISA